MVTGAIFAETPERIGAGGVAVPTELYKAILVSGVRDYRLIAVVMPNAETRARALGSFVVTVAEVEKRTGLIFFPGLDGTRLQITDPSLESTVPTSMP